MIITTKNKEETQNIGKIIASNLFGSAIILLNGDLGAGKTTLVQGVAKYFNIKSKVTSPTFNILKQYPIDSKRSLIHVDAYRLEGASFDELYDYICEDNYIFIEWSDNLSDHSLLKENLTINIQYVNENQRTLEFIANGKMYENMLSEIKKNV